MTKKKNNKKAIDSILKRILIMKSSTGQGNASKELYKMRYGSEWKKFYPAAE